VNKQLVWDLPLRLFHWLLVASLFAQWLTAEVLENATQWHGYIGYFTLGLILFRLIWGFAGTRYSKFSSFMASPIAIFNYAKSLFSGKYQAHVGHNPLGGLLLPATLILVGLQGVSGLFVTDDIIFNGPYFSSVGPQLQDIMQTIHHNVFDWLLYLIGLHIFALLFYKFKLKQNLLKPMIDGKKYIDEKHGVANSQLIKAIILIILISAFIIWLVVFNAPPLEEDYYY
jgi:cytochrome b